jgi:hypothetical protein
MKVKNNWIKMVNPQKTGLAPEIQAELKAGS